MRGWELLRGIAVFAGGDGVQSDDRREDEEDEGEELEVGEKLPAGLAAGGAAGDLVVSEPAALGHHGAVEHEGGLVEPEALEGDGDAVAEVGGEAGGEQRGRHGGGHAEPHEEDQDEVVVPLEALVGGGVEVEQEVLRRERRRPEQTQRAFREREESE